MPTLPILQMNCLLTLIVLFCQVKSPPPVKSFSSHLMHVVLSHWSLDHAQHIPSPRPELKFKKLEKPIPVQMADTGASLNAVAVQEVQITWLPNKETVHVALVVPNMSWSKPTDSLYLFHLKRGIHRVAWKGLMANWS